MSKISPHKLAFFSSNPFLALTYDDVRLRTKANPASPLPHVIDTSGRFSRNVPLKVPFVSAAMDTVTTSAMGIAMARFGGLGVIHAGLGPEDQRREVRRVKLYMNGVVDKPIVVRDSDRVDQVLKMCDENAFEFRTFPVINASGKFVGLVTQNDFDFCLDLDKTIEEIMTPIEKAITRNKQLSLQEAHDIMAEHKVKTLPILGKDGTVSKLFLFSDAKRIIDSATKSNVDGNGRLYTAAAVPTDDEAVERVRLMKDYLDVAVLDSADGDSFYAFETLKKLKAEFPNLDVVVGNVSEGSSALLLAEAGADGIKIGQGPGSICTTRIETGIGMPQVTAVWDSFSKLQAGKFDIPIIADGGIRNHGDISIAVAVGAEAIMMGSMLAGTTEAPGEVMTMNDGTRVKSYRGMGSASALEESAASRKRYGATGGGKPLAEGVESLVPFKGDVADTLETCMKALVKSMRYCKAENLQAHRLHTELIQISGPGLAESHPHITTR